jgi:hypothetical protein
MESRPGSGAPVGSQYVFPGVAGNFASVPDAVNLDITGNFEIVLRMSQADWNAAPAAAFYPVIKSGSAYQIARSPSGQWVAQFYDPGSVLQDLRITQTASIPPGTMAWLRFRVQANNGAGGRTFALDYALDQSPNEPTVWTPMGTPVTSGAAVAVKASTGTLELSSNTGPVTGIIRRVIVRDGIGGPMVLNMTGENAAPGATSFLSADTGVRYAYFPGVAGNFLSVPDAANLNISGDFEIVARCALSDWTPAVINVIANKDVSTGSAVRSWTFRLTATGALQLLVSVDGTALLSAIGSVVPAVDGTALWVKATRVAATGLVSFYSAADAPTEPSSWTARGTASTTAGTMTNGTSPLVIGARSAGGALEPLAGRIMRVIVRNGIDGTTVLNFDAAANLNGVAEAATSFALTTGGTATVNRSAPPATELVTGRQTVTVAQTAGNIVMQPAPIEP